MAVPAVPGPGLIVVKSKLGLGGLKAVLNRPAMPFDLDQCGHVCPGRAPGREKGKLAISNAAADQQTPCPQAGAAAVVFVGLQVGQLAVGPVVSGMRASMRVPLPTALCTSSVPPSRPARSRIER